MTPDEVDALDDDVYDAFVLHMQREAHAIRQSAKRR